MATRRITAKQLRWMERELPDLVAAGVLDAAAADRVQTHFVARVGAQVSPALVLLGSVGGLLIGLGAILLLAHNWSAMGRPLRTLISIAPLAACQGLALWVLARRATSAAWREPVALGLGLLLAAALALIGQTYHVSGDLESFLRAWMVLLLPLPFLLGATGVLLLACAVTIGWFCQAGDLADALLLLVVVTVLGAAVAWRVRREPLAASSAWSGWIALVTGSLALGFLVGRGAEELWPLAFSAWFALAYVLGCRGWDEDTTLWVNPWRALGALGTAVLALVLTFEDAWPRHHGWWWYNHVPTEGVSLAVTGALLAAVALLCWRSVSAQRRRMAPFAVAPAVAFAMYVLHTRDLSTAAVLCANVYAFALGAVLLAAGLRGLQMRSTNAGMAILCIWIALRFFDVDLGFAARGVFFMALGGCFLGVNVWLVRRRRQEGAS
jgi:uncharacterized membrane protein